MARIESGKEFDKEENHQKLKKRMQEMDYSQYTLRIPLSMHKEAKIKMATNRHTMREILLGAIEEYIKK